ncbi:hypothetical protein QG37_04221 [Candidozyma auris]|nr:hypothetical protein QG37_04221 [[Candida] auris]
MTPSECKAKIEQEERVTEQQQSEARYQITVIILNWGYYHAHLTEMMKTMSSRSTEVVTNTRVETSRRGQRTRIYW